MIKSLKTKVSEILVKYDMPTRQIAIDEIIALIDKKYEVRFARKMSKYIEKTVLELNVIKKKEFEKGKRKVSGMREGQSWFNFLEWLNKEKGFGNEESSRLADPFYVSDIEMDELWKEYNRSLFRLSNKKHE